VDHLIFHSEWRGSFVVLVGGRTRRYLCVIQAGSLGFTYTCGHWRQTYWHTSMADRYDINDISELSFVSTLFILLPCELPSRSISCVKLLLVVHSSCLMILHTLKPLCVNP